MTSTEENNNELYLHDHTSTYSILIKYLEEFISSLIKPFIGDWVKFGRE